MRIKTERHVDRIGYLLKINSDGSFVACLDEKELFKEPEVLVTRGSQMERRASNQEQIKPRANKTSGTDL